MRKGICVITYSPLGKAAKTPLSNMIRILSKLGYKPYLITGGDVLKELVGEEKIHLLNVTNGAPSNPIRRIIRHLCMQIKTSASVMKILANCATYIIFLGEPLILPMIILKIARKKTVLMFAMTPSKKHFISSNRNVSAKLWLLFSKINAYLSDYLIVYSYRILREAGLTRLKHKTILAHEHIVDFTRFCIKKEYSKRDCIVGYIGRLSNVKGILNFLEAISVLSKMKDRKNMKFLIGGDGELRCYVENFIEHNLLDVDIIFIGWIQHQILPNVLNRLKIIVVPSYSEALPNIILEAMACGTPVLATAVGAVPDIIKEGKTGFLLRSNDPKHIALRLLEILSRPDLLDRVSRNAYIWVRKNFNKHKTIEIWKRILNKIVKT